MKRERQAKNASHYPNTLPSAKPLTSSVKLLALLKNQHFVYSSVENWLAFFRKGLAHPMSGDRWTRPAGAIGERKEVRLKKQEFFPLEF
jgi:hypothetical protein